MDAIESIHAPGGPCEQHQVNIWKALTALGERVTRLQTQMWMLLIIAGGAWSVLSAIITAVLLAYVFKIK